MSVKVSEEVKSPRIRGSHFRAVSSARHTVTHIHDHTFGKKTIGYMGGFALLINNMIGPGIVAVPLIITNGGNFLPCLAIAIVGILACLASSMMCECMRHVPGNENFRGRVEFIAVIDHFLGDRWAFVSVMFLCGSIITLNMASLIVAANQFDNLFMGLLGQTCGFEFTAFEVLCTSTSETDAAFTQPFVFTFGYLVALCISLPLSMMNLDDNVNVQIVALFVIMGILLFWILELLPASFTQLFDGVNDVPNFWGSTHSAIIGSVLSNFPFVTTVPSWCNERKAEVSINKVLWGSVTICVSIYVIFGLVAANSLSGQVSNQVNFLSALAGQNPGIIGQVCLQVFPFLAALLGVPVMVVVGRYNLMQADVVTKDSVANFIVYGIPFIACLAIGSKLQFIINWGSLFFVGISNFVIPFLVFYKYKMDAIEVGVDEVEFMSQQLAPLLSGRESKWTHWAIPGQQDKTWKGFLGMALAVGVLSAIFGTAAISGN